MVVGDGHAPLWQCCSGRQTKKADESIPAPKGHGPPDPAACPLQIANFQGPPEGAIIAFLDPFWRAPTLISGGSHAPVVAVRLAFANRAVAPNRLQHSAWTAMA
jgi:hypothetical protein